MFITTIITDGIQIEKDNSLSFGNYQSEEKIKINDFEHLGDNYVLRTSKEMNRLQKNGGLLIESIPGSSIHYFNAGDEKIVFDAYGFKSTQITLELEPNTKYRIVIDDVVIDGSVTSNSSGKISFSTNLNEGKHNILIEKNSL